MSSYVTPKKNTAFILYIGLTSQADTNLLQPDPNIAAGDFKVSTDGGALGNLATLPTVTPAAGKMVKISLSAGEMNGDNVTVVCSDAAGAEWCDQIINIQTSTRQIDDLAFPTVSGRSLDVTATGAAGVDWSNVENPTTTLNLSGTSTKAVEPTVAGRTLDVSATGEAGIDWANIGAPTTTVALTGTSTKSLQPTVAGRTLDVTAAGEAGIDWANIGAPTTAQNLSGTSTKAVEPTVAGRTLDVAATGEAGLDFDNVKAASAPTTLTNITVPTVTTVASVTSVVGIGAGGLAAIADAAWDEAISGHLTAGSTGAALNAAGSSGDPWATPLPGAYGAGTAGKIIGDNINATISSRTKPADTQAAVTSVLGIAAGPLGDIEDAVWDAAITSHLTSGSTGASLNAAGSSGDPWATSLPGAYGAGTAGKIIGDNINATISSRTKPADTQAAVTLVGSVSGAVGSVTGAVGSVTGNVGGNVVGSVGSVVGAVGSVAGAVGSVTGNVGGNVVGSVASVVGAVGSVTGNVGGNVTGNLGGTLSTTERDAIADAFLDRNMAAGVDSGSSSFRTVRQAFRAIRNKISITTGTLTVCKEDDATASWTAAVGTDAAADPVTSIDPAGP